MKATSIPASVMASTRAAPASIKIPPFCFQYFIDMPVVNNTMADRNLHGITFIKTLGLVILDFFAAACSTLHNIGVES